VRTSAALRASTVLPGEVTVSDDSTLSASTAARPRIVLLTMPSLFGAEIMNRLAREPGIELAGVGVSVRVNRKKSWFAGVNAFRAKTGWRYFLFNALVADVAWDLLRLTRRPSCLRGGAIRLRRLADVNSETSLQWLRELRPDFVVSFVFNQWIGAEVRQCATTACLNLHPAPLPALRGADPVFRALDRGLTSTGLTIHEVADEIDAGAIRHQATVAIPPGSSECGLYWLLIRDGADLFARFLAGRVDPVVPRLTPTTGDDYTSFPTAAEVAAFRKAGGRLLRFAEWRQALAAIE